jgi:hypothetical protein
MRSVNIFLPSPISNPSDLQTLSTKESAGYVLMCPPRHPKGDDPDLFRHSILPYRSKLGHPPRQLRIEPHDPILSDREIRRMQRLRFKE